MPLTTVRARLTFWYALFLGVPLIGFAVLSLLLLSSSLLDRTDAFIRDALNVFTRELASERRALPTLDAAIGMTVHDVRFRDVDVIVIDDAGALIAASAPLNEAERERHAFPADSVAILHTLRAAGDTSHAITFTSAQQSYRLLRRPLRLEDRQFTIGAVYPLREIESTLQRIRWLFLGAIPLLIAIAAAGGYFLAKRSLAPVATMTARAAEISASTLHERLPVGAQDELGALARVLNDLLDRLERAFAQQRRFMADASHELRTPTATLRTEADVTLSRDTRPEAEYRESMMVVQDAARRVSRIVDDIFLLARADAGHLNTRSEQIYLEDVVHDAMRAVKPIADLRNITIDLAAITEAPFTGDADLLGRLLLNLLDNAIKHSHEQGTVTVALRSANGNWQIDVTDAGPGIPADAQARIFERFFRVDSARARPQDTTTTGAGLGLSIARRIAELHGGRLDLLGSGPGRTEFRITLPASARPAR